MDKFRRSKRSSGRGGTAPLSFGVEAVEKVLQTS
jgi:hypothetical protein